jgi:hypothetical protein
MAGRPWRCRIVTFSIRDIVDRDNRTKTRLKHHLSCPVQGNANDCPIG